jgi:hypothetical protein
MITRLGYTPSETLLYNAPSGAVQIAAIWLGVLLCKLFPNRRCLVVVGLILIPITGCIMLLTLPFEGWPIIAGSWLVRPLDSRVIHRCSNRSTNAGIG